MLEPMTEAPLPPNPLPPNPLPPNPLPPGGDLETAVRRALAELRPHLVRDGGDIELVGVDGDLVVVDMKGTCSGCVLASVTLAGVKKRLIDAIGRPVKVVPRSAVNVFGPMPSRQAGAA